MTPFKILFLGMVTFMRLTDGNQQAVFPNGSSGRFVNNKHVERHTAYVAFLMSDYLRSTGWGAPNKFKSHVTIPEMELKKNEEYGMYALDGFTITVSHAPEAFQRNISHCLHVPHLRMECAGLGTTPDNFLGTKDKNVLSADMVIDSGLLLGRTTSSGGPRFSSLNLKTPTGINEIEVTAKSFDGTIVRTVFLKKGATIWLGNEWSGKFTNRNPNGENHWLLHYTIAASAPGCACSPKPIAPQDCDTATPKPIPGQTENGPNQCGGHDHLAPDPSKAYTIACSNSNYP